MSRKILSISVAQDFSRFPAGRYQTDGPNSGERFREELLAPSLRTADLVTVKLDGTRGYGSSFLEEAFGGLVRLGYFKADELQSKLAIESKDPSLEAEIRRYIRTSLDKVAHA